MSVSESYIIKEELSPPALLRGAGLIFGVSSLPLLFELPVLGVLGFVLSVVCFIPNRIRTVDVKNKQYNTGITFGKWPSKVWISMPKNISYVSLLAIKQKSTLYSTVGIAGLKTTTIYQDYQVNLIYNKRDKFKIGTSSNFEEAFQIAKRCSNFLQKDIFVVQPGKKYWIRFES